ncbi:rho-related GTP-binding protein RhoN, partial [Silurus meridionalis]
MEGQGQISRCKIVVVGDTQCGKTALLHVFAKDNYPESYVPTVFENYTASFEIDKHRIELNMWDTSGSVLEGKRKAKMCIHFIVSLPLSSHLLCCCCSANHHCHLLSFTLSLTQSIFIHLSQGGIKMTPHSGHLLQSHRPLFHSSCYSSCATHTGTNTPFCVFTGSSYYDNVRPLAYPDSDAVLICFDISRPETLDSVPKKWQAEAQEYCPSAKLVLVGCKLDMRTDVSTLRELSKQRLIPVTHEQGSLRARELGAVAYVECSSRMCVNSVRDVFHITTLASVRRPAPGLKRSSSRRTLKRISHQPLLPINSRTTPIEPSSTLRKDRAKSCNIM